MIRFENVSKIYKGDFAALEDINLEIKEGEFVTIIGQSGAGKSTLLKLIYAEEMPTSGAVVFEEMVTSNISRRKLPYYRRNIGTIFQDFKLLPRKTAFENVAFALEVASIPREEIEEDVPQMLEIVGLGDKMEKFPYQLSMGEQQRVSFARALIHRPKIIVADEPTGNLDPVSSWDIVNLMLKINKLGTTVILASHDKDVVDKANKRVVVIEKGKIIGDYEQGRYKLV
jgi:cell division transport system ATP-binding protein